MTINDLVIEAHKTAKEKGWWERPRSVGECLALIHSEVSEALEDWRKGHMDAMQGDMSCGRWADSKPCGFPIELADILIRVADLAGHLAIDLEYAVKVKLHYNRGREYRHGGKRA